MTREEILDGLYEIKNWKCNGDAKMHEVVNEVIKELKQEPCEDAISRKNTLAEFRRVYFDNDAVIRCAELVLGGLPSVTPQTKWIPVSEKLPEVQKNGDKDFSDWVQVTIDISRNGDSDVYVCEAYYCFSENKWYTKRFVIGVVTAWMPLPEPFDPDTDVDSNEESEVNE